MRVWIDQDLCTGDGLCVDHCHEVFTLLEDGIAYVIEEARVLNDPGGSSSIARVDPRFEQSVVDAALACPGECIFIEVAHIGEPGHGGAVGTAGGSSAGSATPSTRPVVDDDDDFAA
ncbi:MAG: ferredoxin [Ilumatobacteraceae bacterium]